MTGIPFLAGLSTQRACHVLSIRQIYYACVTVYVLLLNASLMHFRSTLKSDQNQKTLDTVVREVRVLHSNFSLSAVTGMTTFINFDFEPAE